MKWYFCWCHETDFRKDHAWPDLIRVAVESAIQNTNLEPHFIYDGPENDFTRELAEKGVNIHYHKLSFEDKIKSHSENKQWQSIARGAFLRFDIPLIDDGSEEFVLYTDADVIFQKGGDKFNGYCPEFIAAASQFDRGSIRDLNSGIMILNIKKWKEKHKDLVSFTERNLNLGLDQEILRKFVGENYLLLPDRFNWKPYWGINPDAAIIHWHGPKPEALNEWLKDTSAETHKVWNDLLRGTRKEYIYYVNKYKNILQIYKEKNNTSIRVEYKNNSPICANIVSFSYKEITGFMNNPEYPESDISFEVIPENGKSFIVGSKHHSTMDGKIKIWKFTIDLQNKIPSRFFLLKDLAGRTINVSQNGLLINRIKMS